VPAFIALLRAVNVGGTGKLAMGELRAVCERAGLRNVTTYIQSGNVVFTSDLPAAKLKTKLEGALARTMESPVRVFIRTPPQLAAILERNPFPRAAPSRVIVLFLDRVARESSLAGVDVPGREEIRASGREVFILYPDGMGRSKLKTPFHESGTGRNLNTVAKLLELGRAARS